MNNKESMIKREITICFFLLVTTIGLNEDFLGDEINFYRHIPTQIFGYSLQPACETLSFIVCVSDLKKKQEEYNLEHLGMQKKVT